MKKIKQILALNIALAGFFATDIAFAKVVCPSQKFNVFLNAYQDSLIIQKRFSENPLVWSDYTDSYDSPTVVFKKHALIEWPIMPSRRQQTSQKLTRELTKLSNIAQQVLIASTNSDAHIFKYSFHKAYGCWQLNRVDDLSLNN